MSDVDRAVGRRDDADRERLAPRRTGCRSPRPARRPGPRRWSPSWSGVQVEAIRVDLEQRDVGVRVEADDARGDLVAVGELDVDLLRLVDRARRRSRVGDDVGVGGDLAVAGDHEAGPLAARAAAAKEGGAPPAKIERIVTTPGAAAGRWPRDRRRRCEDMDDRPSCCESLDGRDRVVGPVSRSCRRTPPSGQRHGGQQRGARSSAGALNARRLDRRRPAARSVNSVRPRRESAPARRPCAGPARGRSPGRGPEPLTRSPV